MPRSDYCDHDWDATYCPVCGAWQGDQCNHCGAWSDGGDWNSQFLEACTCTTEELEAYYNQFNVSFISAHCDPAGVSADKPVPAVPAVSANG